MATLFVRCRSFVAADEECTVVLAAENLEEVIEAAVEHAYATHAEEDTPELRERIRTAIREDAFT
jgi:predicted small metal-binding protein